MAEEIDWSLTTFEGNRRFQHREFLALPLRRKLEVIEGLGELAARLDELREGRRSSATGIQASPGDHDGALDAEHDPHRP